MYKTLDGKVFATEAEVLADHDENETLHAFVPAWQRKDGSVRMMRNFSLCRECGDTEEGLMHNNTERNIEPLLSEDN